MNILLNMMWIVASVTLLFSGKSKLELKKKILNNAAFELEGRILRCSDVISNSASTEKVKNGKAP